LLRIAYFYDDFYSGPDGPAVMVIRINAGIYACFIEPYFFGSEA